MSSLHRFGPLPAAIALAAGIASAPALDNLGVPPSLRWVLAALLVLGVRRIPALAVAAVIAVGAARGAATRVVLPPGVVADDRVEDRITGVVEGPVIRTVRGSGAQVSALWVWADELLVPGDRIAATGSIGSSSRRGESSTSARSPASARAPGGGRPRCRPVRWRGSRMQAGIRWRAPHCAAS